MFQAKNEEKRKKSEERKGGGEWEKEGEGERRKEEREGVVEDRKGKSTPLISLSRSEGWP